MTGFRKLNPDYTLHTWQVGRGYALRTFLGLCRNTLFWHRCVPYRFTIPSLSHQLLIPLKQERNAFCVGGFALVAVGVIDGFV